jgi:hypothetical protein
LSDCNSPKQKHEDSFIQKLLTEIGKFKKKIMPKSCGMPAELIFMDDI